MTRKSSLHIKPRSVPAALLHNARVFNLSYAVKNKSVNDDKLFKTPNELMNLLREIKTDYQKHSYRGRRLPNTATPIREGVVNLEAHHTMKDVQKMAEKVAQKMEVEVLSISIHRDEGKGKDNINYHAHILFNYFNFDTHKTTHHKSHIMSEVQTIVANELGMERGKSKKETGIKHIPHGQYRAIAKAKDEAITEAKAPLIKNVTELKKKITELSNDLKTANGELEDGKKLFTKEDYQQLNKLKKKLNKKTFSEVVQSYYKLHQAYTQIKNQNQNLKEENEQFKRSRRGEYKRVTDSINQATNDLKSTTKGDIRGATQAYKTKQTARANAQIASRISNNFIQFHTEFERSTREITDNLYIKKIDQLKASKSKGVEEVLDDLSEHTGINSNKLFDLVDQEIKKQNKPLDIKIESTVIDYEYHDVAIINGTILDRNELAEPTEQELKAIKDKGFNQNIDLISKKLSQVIQNLNTFISNSSIIKIQKINAV